MFAIVNIIKCLPSLSLASEENIFRSQIAIYLRGKSAIVYWNCVSLTFICHCSVRKVCSCRELLPHCNPFVMQTFCVYFFSPGMAQTSHLLRLDSLVGTPHWNLSTRPPTLSSLNFTLTSLELAFLFWVIMVRGHCAVWGTCMLYLNRSLYCFC